MLLVYFNNLRSDELFCRISRRRFKIVSITILEAKNVAYICLKVSQTSAVQYETYWCDKVQI